MRKVSRWNSQNLLKRKHQSIQEFLWKSNWNPLREISQIRWITKTVFFSQLTKNFTNIPDFRFPDLFNYLVGKDPVYNSESLKSYKSLLEYELFFDGHMEELWYHPPQPNGNYSYFKFAVKPTEKSKTDDGSAKYRGFFILKKDGSVLLFMQRRGRWRLPAHSSSIVWSRSKCEIQWSPIMYIRTVHVEKEKKEKWGKFAHSGPSNEW